MKKLVTLLLAAGLVFSAANSASAVDVQVSGAMDFSFDWWTNKDFQATKDGGDPEKHSGALQRLRLGLDLAVSENLSAFYQLQVGEFTWGGPALVGEYNLGRSGGGLGTRAANITSRLAYLDWMVPNTSVKVRMGQQPVAMPSFVFGSPVLDDPATGIIVSAPVTDSVAVTAGWIRPFADNIRGTDVFSGRAHSLADLFYLNADVKGEGFKVSPWALVGPAGKDTLAFKGGNGVFAKWADVEVSELKITPRSDYDDGFMWFAGISAEMTMFDPFRFAADFYYSSLDADGRNNGPDYSAGGWYAALAAEYTTAYGTGALKGWYASGDDEKAATDNEYGQPLTLSGFFNPTMSYFAGRKGIGNAVFRTDAGGTWGVGLYWSGLSFVQNLSHDFAVVYFQGTNDKDSGVKFDPTSYLTTKDSAVELDFATTYKIYENLATTLELSYILQDFDEDLQGRAKYSDNFRCTLNFKYAF